MNGRQKTEKQNPLKSGSLTRCRSHGVRKAAREFLKISAYGFFRKQGYSALHVALRASGKFRDALSQFPFTKVETGHWFSGKEIVVSPKNVDRISNDESKVFVSVTKESIENAPEFHVRPWAFQKVQAEANSL